MILLLEAKKIFKQKKIQYKCNWKYDYDVEIKEINAV